MKKLLYFALGLTFVFGMSSCDDYLDINIDPDNPISETATVDIRLPWIQNYYAYAWGTAGMRVNTILGLLTQTSATSANGYLAAWNPQQSSATTVYQNWYVGAAVNIQPMINKGEDTQEYHYIGAGYCIKAMGFMMMLDLHGELPIQEAFILKTDPAYDDGKTMFNLCLEYIDKAIENLSKEQPSGTKPLKNGDLWNGGDVSKWLKLCYGLKARYLLKLSKKTDIYKPDDILAALDKAPKSNADNTTMKHYNVVGDETNFTVADPYQTSALWNCVAYGTTQRTTRYYADMLNNTFEGGTGLVDPRMSKLLPAMMTNIRETSEGLKYEWLRDIGVDMMHGTIRQDGGPFPALYAIESEVNKVKYPYVDVKYTIADATAREKFIADAEKVHLVTVSGNDVTVRYQRGAAYCNTTNYKLAGDTVYINMRSNSMSTSGRGENDLFYYPASGYDYVLGTGTFYARPNSDTDFLTYHEMCFIKAEVYMRKGDKAKAFEAYKLGIRAHFDRMQAKLTEWRAANSKNPDEMPMDEAEIAAYLASDALCQSAVDLTMADIMGQKLIAMGFDPENWNDIRRFNYSAGNIGDFGNVYPNYVRPREFSATSKIPGTSPSDVRYWFRRWHQSTHESNYNLTQLRASNKYAMQNEIWSIPVWWDCATDAEYFGYIE